MRSVLRVAGLVLLQACATVPRLAPTAAGCYAVRLDSVPAQFAVMHAPPLPSLVQLDTTLGGQLRVPRAWLEADGVNVRRALVQTVRPGWRVVGGEVVVERARLRPYPADSLVLRFWRDATELTALIGAAPSGDWQGWVFVPSSTMPASRPVVPVALTRTTCGETPMALSRTGW